MYEGLPVEIKMERIVTPNGIFDEGTHYGTVIKYDSSDYIKVKLKEENLLAISLDAKYRCYIVTSSETLMCYGVIEERYRSREGNVIVFRIENGFFATPEAKKVVRKTIE